MLKKFLLVILTSVIFFNPLIIPATVFAAPTPTPGAPTINSNQPWFNQNPFSWYGKVYDTKNASEIFGERYTAAQVQWIIYSLLTAPFAILESFKPDGPCLLSAFGGGAELGACAGSYFTSLTDALKSSKSSNLIFNDKKGLALVFDASNRDVSAIKYVSQQIGKFSLIKTANAQEGFGFGALGVVQNLWRASRNMAYAVVVLITIVFAFMIMFRVKISPQVVISVQSALPKIMVGLVLVTFSYAIAGLMVDLMYVFTGFISAILSSMFTAVTSGFTDTYNFISGNSNVSSFLVVFLYMLVYLFLFIIAIVINFVSFVATFSVFQLILSVLLLFVAVWLVVLLFVYTIKIPWVLIKTLASVYMSVIIAPLQIIFGVIAPQAGFGTWLKNLIANLLVFPVTGFLFYIAYLLIYQSLLVWVDVILERNWIAELLSVFGLQFEGILPGTLWSPPLLGSGAEISSLIFAIMSFMVIVAIPKATEIVKMLVLGEKFAFGTAIGEAMAPAKWAMNTAYNQSGARDIAEISQVLRKSRIMDKYIGEGTKGGRLVERFIGGDHEESSGAIKTALGNYRERAGRPKEI